MQAPRGTLISARTHDERRAIHKEGTVHNSTFAIRLFGGYTLLMYQVRAPPDRVRSQPFLHYHRAFQQLDCISGHPKGRATVRLPYEHYYSLIGESVNSLIEDSKLPGYIPYQHHRAPNSNFTAQRQKYVIGRWVGRGGGLGAKLKRRKVTKACRTNDVARFSRASLSKE